MQLTRVSRREQDERNPPIRQFLPFRRRHQLKSPVRRDGGISARSLSRAPSNAGPSRYAGVHSEGEIALHSFVAMRTKASLQNSTCSGARGARGCRRATRLSRSRPIAPATSARASRVRRALRAEPRVRSWLGFELLDRAGRGDRGDIGGAAAASATASSAESNTRILGAVGPPRRAGPFRDGDVMGLPAEVESAKVSEGAPGGRAASVQPRS